MVSSSYFSRFTLQKVAANYNLCIETQVFVRIGLCLSILFHSRTCLLQHHSILGSYIIVDRECEFTNDTLLLFLAHYR